MTVFKYSVMRYVNDIEKDEAINIGVIVMEKGAQTYVCKLIDDFELVKRIHPDSSIMEMREFVEAWRGEHKLGLTLSELAERFQHQLQFTPPRTSIGKDLHIELDDIYDEFISVDKKVPENGATVGHSSIMKIVYDAIQTNIEELGISAEHVKKNYVIGDKKREIKADFAFQNGCLNDLIKIIPVTASNLERARGASTVLATDYTHAKAALNGARFHAFVHCVEEGSDITDPITEDLKSSGLFVKGFDDIRPCLNEIKVRLSE